MSDTRRHPNVINLAEISPQPGMQHGDRFAFSARRLGPAVGGRQLGCSWYDVPPGKTAFPFHFHCANEEAMYVLEGEGTMRIGDARVPIRAGDYIALPVGLDGAHQLLNTGDAPLRYLCFSTMHPVEVAGYPDSDKIGAMAMKDGAPMIRKIFPASATTDYFTGE
jgi:uncharacterized cupin superfamily protein